MSKELFDHMDDRMREAAENTSPAFREDAWEAMEVLLDKEFGEKRRRRIFFWIWPLAGLIIGGTFYLYNGNHSDKHNFAIEQQRVNKAAIENVRIRTNEHIVENTKAHAINKKGEEQISIDAATKNLNSGILVRKRQQGIILKKNYNPFISTVTKNTEEKENREVDNDKEIVYIQDNILPKNEVIKPATDSTKTSSIISPDTLNATPGPKRKVKNKEKIPSGFYITGYGGIDNNGIHDVVADNATGRYGIGIGYKVNKRFSLQVGLFGGKKKYKATGKDYKFEQYSPLSNAYVMGIDADCSVFDIPVSIRYDITPKKNYSFYGMAGFSSYIMKDESYVYHYKMNGSYNKANWKYKGNVHLLSVINISLGYERKLSNTLSALVEPYARIPLAGVGEGKVNLHSTGLLLGVKYNLPKTKKTL